MQKKSCICAIIRHFCSDWAVTNPNSVNPPRTICGLVHYRLMCLFQLCYRILYRPIRALSKILALNIFAIAEMALGHSRSSAMALFYWSFTASYYNFIAFSICYARRCMTYQFMRSLLRYMNSLIIRLKAVSLSLSRKCKTWSTYENDFLPILMSNFTVLSLIQWQSGMV